MKWFSILVVAVCLCDVSIASAQSKNPRDPSCACAADDTSRLMAAGPKYFVPAVPTPKPVLVSPTIRGSSHDITTRSASRIETFEPTPVTAIVGCAPLQISIPEGLLNRFLATERSELAPVRDVIAKADVTGQQATSTRVVVDVKPSNTHAEIHLVLTGDVQSTTIGRTSLAAVKTLGRHDVLAVKPVMFDGYQITTKRPQVWVDVHNEHVAAATAYDGTLFGGMARNTAIKTANKQKKQVDAETAEHLADQLGPQFNREADQKLGQFNRDWRDSLRLRFGDLWPQRLSARSTDSELVLSAAWADAPEMSWQEITRFGSSAKRTIDNDAVTVWMHESVLNSSLRRLNLAGKSMTEAELRGTLEKFVTSLGGKVLPRDPKAAVPTPTLPGAAPLIKLGDKDPVRVTIADGELKLIIVAGIEVAGQTVLAQDEITLPLSSKIERGEWRVTPGQLVFANADKGVTLVGMMATMARTQLAAAIPTISLPDSLLLPGISSKQSTTPLRLARAEAASGWLTLSLKVGAESRSVSEPQFPQPQPEEYVPFEQFRSEPVPVSPPRLRAPSDFESRRDRSFFR